MARYHNVLLEAKKTPTYKPMDPKEKAARIQHMEARLSGKIILDDKGEFKKYGFVAGPKPGAVQEWPTTDFGFEPKMVTLPEPKVEKEVTVVEEVPVQAVKVENDGWPVLETGPILTQEDVNKRLDNLVAFSGAVLEHMKKVFNQ